MEPYTQGRLLDSEKNTMRWSNVRLQVYLFNTGYEY